MPRAALVAACALLVATACRSDDRDPAPAVTAPAATSPAAATTTGSSGPPTSVPAGPDAADPTTTDPSTTPTGPYADPARWICRADLDDICDESYPITEVGPDGSLVVLPYEVDPDPAADCFYAYPTTSEDPTTRSDLVPGREVGTVQVQAARFSQVCAVYAPVYRSVTLAGLFGGFDPTDWQAAYEDVLAAWRHYLAHDNAGRPVVLIGHSQGSAHLTRLLAEEIEPDPAQRARLVSALLIGTNFAVLEGADVGVATQLVPLCRSVSQTGCVVTYASYPATSPPSDGALFGRPFGFPLGAGEGVSGCTNPAALSGGPAELRAAFPTDGWALDGPDDGITTPFMSFPGLVTGECVTRNGYTYLEISVNADPADPRVDDPPGSLTPEWGLHAIDIQLAQESLIDLVRQQVDAFGAS